MSTTVFAADPSITYSPQSAWFSSDGAMYTFSAGVTAELSFTGEFVEVYGTPMPVAQVTPSVSTYVLDNNTPVMFNSANVSDVTFAVLAFYQSPPGLMDGHHSLLITSAENQTSTENQTSFILDYIVFGSNLSNSTSTASPSSTTGTPKIPIPPSSSSTLSPTPNSDINSSSFKIPVGGIVGGVIAALV